MAQRKIFGYTGGVLPINWIKIIGKINNQKQTVIYWVVDEINVSNYYVEVSKDCVYFNEIGIIQSKSNGLNNYKFIGSAGLQNHVYYRIKEADINGNFSYSRIIKISGRLFSNLSIYPNPVKDMLTISGVTIGKKITLLDITGRHLQNFMITQPNFTIDLGKFNNGLYIIKTSKGAVQKIIKQ